MNKSLGDWITAYGGRLLGVGVGLLLALFILQYGLLRTVFILMVIAIGYFIGLRIDEAGGVGDFFERLIRRD